MSDKNAGFWAGGRDEYYDYLENAKYEEIARIKDKYKNSFDPKAKEKMKKEIEIIKSKYDFERDNPPFSNKALF